MNCLRRLLPVLFIPLCGFAAEPQSPATGEENDGWQSLFDGETLAGWRGYLGAPIEDAWEVEDGVLKLRGGSSGEHYVSIITEQTFDNFELVWDWQLEPGSNSGLMFHVKEGPKQPYLTGPEYQLLDDKGFRNAKGEPVPPVEYTGSHYAIEEAWVDAAKPVGEWNTSRIKVVGDHVEYFLNGEKTADYTMHSDKWKQQVAAVKFGKWELFGTTGEGHFALQDHGHAAAFRNLKVRRLNPDGRP